MLTQKFDGTSRMRDLAVPTALLVALLVLATIIGAATGVVPLIAVPIGLLATAIAMVALGSAVAKSAVGSSKGWHGFVLLTFWGLVVNVPTFLAFDQTGFTRDYGLFNPQSLSRIAVFVLSAGALLFFWVLWGRDGDLRAHARLPRGIWLLAALYCWYLLTSPLGASGNALALSTFRALEWIVAIALLCMSFALQDAMGKTGFTERTRLLWPVFAFLVLSNLLLLPVVPNVIYQTSPVTGVSRLGGLFTHPNLLAMVATLGFAHALAYHLGWRRAIYAAVALATAAMTYSRGGYVALAATLLLALFVLMRGVGRKTVVVTLVIAGGVGAMAIPDVNDAVYRYLSRGNERAGLQTLSERTAVWQAARVQIARSPWLGEGFISGPKRLGEIMIEQRYSRNFAAPHAHNELLQAQISGGVVASLLVLAIHLRIGYLLFKRRALSRSDRFFGWSVFACCLVWGALAPSLSYFLSLPGMLLIWLLLSLESAPALPLTAGERESPKSEAIRAV